MNAVPVVLDALQPLSRFPGVFVFGSNDYYGPKIKNPARYLFPDSGRRIHGPELPWHELRDGLIERGWVDLTHRRTSMTINDLPLEFRGVDDPHLELDDYSSVAGPVADAHFGIGVTHAPYLRVLDGMSADDVPLILAGHTHGGQLCLPFVGALTTNCDLDLKRAKGVHRHRDAWMHVSAGLGTNPYTPVRFACRPEASLLTLKSAL
jgi:predicted MPP superfamily phosphohydrolase